MESVTVSRRIPAAPESVRETLDDVESFIAAGGFEEVIRDENHLTMRNRLGFATIELTVSLTNSAALAFEQVDGIFDEMRTRYTVDPINGDCRIRATTEFELGGGPIGELLDAWVIRRQRISEIERQFDYLERELTPDTKTTGN